MLGQQVKTKNKKNCLIVGSGETCDQNGSRVSKYNTICYICRMKLKKLLVKYKKYLTLSICECSLMGNISRAQSCHVP